MRDTVADRQKLLDQLESSLGIANELHEAVLAFLIERAIDEARASSFGIIRTRDDDPA